MRLSRIQGIALTVALTAMTAMLCACSRPEGYCRFISKKTDAQQSYYFKVSTLDSLASYKVSVLCSYDANKYPLTSAICILRYIAPDSTETYRDVLLKAEDADNAKRSGSVVDLSWTVQRRAPFPHDGEWGIVVQIPNVEFCKAVTGFGIDLEKEKI
jgi:hypothetical protein